MSDFDRSTRRPDPGSAVFLQVGLGIALVFVLHAVVGFALYGGALLAQEIAGPAAAPFVTLFTLWAMTLSVTQLAYVGPVAAAVYFVRPAIALGTIIGAALTVMLQGACYGLVAVVMLGLFSQM